MNAATLKAPTQLINAIINRYLSLDPEMAEKLSAYQDKVIAVEPHGFNRTIYLFPQSVNEKNCIEVSGFYEGNVDTRLKGSAPALFKMGMASDVAPLMLKGEVEIEGDVRLGREFKQLLREMDADWEEVLSSVIGDAPAHQLSKVVKDFSGWLDKAKTAFSANISEYLQEESRDVVSGAELEIFYEDVDELRNDVDRLQAKIDQLKQK